MRTTKIHRKIYEDYHNIRLSSDVEIHHIDGNHGNNDITNLKLVSIQEHYDIHHAQGDWAACLLMSHRMKLTPEEKSRLASLAASKGNAEGKCGFKLGHASKAGKIGGKKGGVFAKENFAYALLPDVNAIPKSLPILPVTVITPSPAICVRLL